MKKDGIEQYHNILSSNGANFAKIIATFCVVLVHSHNIFGYAQIPEDKLSILRGFETIAFSGVPIFFLLSGYFLMLKDNWNWKTNIRKKIRSLLIPYCCFITVYTIINCIGYHIAPNMFDNYKAFSVGDWFERLIGQPFVSAPHFYDPLWFLRDLFILNLMTILIVPIIKKCPENILIPALAIIWFLPIHPYMRQSIVFFILGMSFGNKSKLPLIRSPLLLFFLFGIGFVLPIIVSGDYSMQFALLPMILFILSISEKLIKQPKIVHYSHLLIPFNFPVYLTHGYLLTLIQRIVIMKVHPCFLSVIILYLLLPFVIVALCILLSFIWKKTLPKTYSIFIGGH